MRCHSHVISLPAGPPLHLFLYFQWKWLQQANLCLLLMMVCLKPLDSKGLPRFSAAKSTAVCEWILK